MQLRTATQPSEDNKVVPSRVRADINTKQGEMAKKRFNSVDQPFFEHVRGEKIASVFSVYGPKISKSKTRTERQQRTEIQAGER